MGLFAHGSSTALAAGKPEVKATFVEGVSATAANLWAEINGNGLTGTYRFEYLTQAAYEANLKAAKEGFTGAAKTPSAPLGSGSAQKLTQHIGGLIPATTYRYRVVATNSAGTTIGEERSLTTQESGTTFHLPDARAWEMVSPVDKDGGAIQEPGTLFGGGDFQAAAQGGSFAYSSATAFSAAKSAPPVSQYLSSRTGSGWATQNVSPPLDSAAYGDEPDGAPYRLFSEALSGSVLFGGDPCRGVAGCPEPSQPLAGSGAPSAYPTLYLRQTQTGAYTSLLHQADLEHTAVTPENFEASLVAAVPDLSRLVISTCAALTSNATEVSAGAGKCDPAEQNLYAWSGGGLSLLNLLPGDTTGTPGAEIAAPLGAVFAEGARTYFTQAGALYLREANQTELLPQSGGGGAFQLASSDGSLAYFLKAGHLYRYQVSSQESTDITPSGGVAGVLGASASGETVYFQDAAGLWRWQEGSTAQVAGGAGVALSSNYPPATGTARVSADGTHIAFLTDRELTDYENAGAREAYLWGPLGGGSPQLICVSCNPTGERPGGSASLPGAPPNGSLPLSYKPRALSANGQRLFFETADDLVIQDTNSPPDVYQWEAQGVGDCTRSPGCVNLISSGRSSGGASFLDASADGSDAYFLTDGSLVSSDPGSIDVYDARVGGGLPEAIKPIPCVADACQALPPTPEDPTPGTLLKGPENPPLHFRKEKKKKHKPKQHKKKHHPKSHKQGRGR